VTSTQKDKLIEIMSIFSSHFQLEIIDHDIAISTGRPSEKIVQYKIMDKNVTFFAPGNSASVL
jgi:hypothetical protein